MKPDWSNYEAAPASPPPDFQPERSLEPVRDSKLRFSAPYLPGTFPSGDTLRGFHLGNVIPQWRIPVPAGATAQGATTTSTATTITSSSSSSTTTNNPAKAQTASITTPVMNPGDRFVGILTMAKGFEIWSVATNAAARIRLYATKSAQTADLARPSSQGPGFGNEQGIIVDWYLDTAPVVYEANPYPSGRNADSPQSTSIYLTVDAIGVSSGKITITVTFVPLQS